MGRPGNEASQVQESQRFETCNSFVSKLCLISQISATPHLFGTLIVNEGGVVFFLLLLVNLLGHSGKRGGGWGHIVSRFSYLPRGPVSHNTILCSSPVSEPGVGGGDGGGCDV